MRMSCKEGHLLIVYFYKRLKISVFNCISINDNQDILRSISV